MKNKKSILNTLATVLLIIMTVFLALSIVFVIAENKLDNSMDAPSGEMMLSHYQLYGIENTSPFDIVEDVAEYRFAKNQKEDKYTNLAIALAEYREAAFYKYAYEYVGDNAKAEQYQKVLDSARERMEVHSFADYIDKNYKEYSER